jgi:hypothetical protein
MKAQAATANTARGELQRRRHRRAQQPRTERGTGHTAQAEHAVKAAHHLLAAVVFEQAAFGIDGHIEQRAGGAESQHECDQYGISAGAEHRRESSAQQQGAHKRGGARTEGCDDAAGQRQADHGTECKGQQGH